ncbi:MAG: monophosphatase, partial [Ilumatobacteraceae bacterium]
MTDLAEELCGLASRLAIAAGELVFEGRKNGLTSISTKSSDTDVVTEFDRASERLIVVGLRAERPDDAVVGEEGTDDVGESGVRWLIDPIDGTTNFQYDLPGYAVSIAALDGDRQLAGVVYIPGSRELFTATAGGGANLNGSPIHCGTLTTLQHALVATGFSYQVERRREQAQRIAEVIP